MRPNLDIQICNLHIFYFVVEGLLNELHIYVKKFTGTLSLIAKMSKFTRKRDNLSTLKYRDLKFKSMSTNFSFKLCTVVKNK